MENISLRSFLLSCLVGLVVEDLKTFSFYIDLMKKMELLPMNWMTMILI